MPTLVTLPYLLWRMRQLRSVHDADELLRLVFHGLGGAVRPIQIPAELREFMTLLQQKKPRRILEIGTARGGTLMLLCRCATPDAHLISVDLPGGWFGGGYARWRRPLYRSFAKDRQRLDLIRADSHSAETLEQVRRLLDGRKLDVILIDGDHTYDGVRADFESYGQLLADDGIIAFHDIAPNPHEPACQVDRFWRELRGRHRVRELVDDWEQGGAGIGLLMGPAPGTSPITPPAAFEPQTAAA